MTTPNDQAFATTVLRSSARALASAVLARLQEEAPDAIEQLPKTFATPRDDIEVRLRHLVVAVEFDRPVLFEDAIRWYAIALHHRGVSNDYLSLTLDVIGDVLREELPSSAQAIVQRHITAAQQTAKVAETDLPSHLDQSTPHGLLACKFLLATLEGRGDDAMDLIKSAFDDGMSIAELHDNVLMPVQQETGRMWLMGEIQVADEHFGSTIVSRVLWSAKDRLPLPPTDAPAVLTMGVSGDLHGFGLQMIEQRLHAAGMRVHNLGPDMPAADLPGTLHGRWFDLVAISATMALQLSPLKDLIATIRKMLGPKVPIIVGGKPFAIVPDLHTLVGADAAAANGTDAVEAANRLLKRASGEAS